MKEGLEHWGQWILSTEEEIQHFKEWRELYGPSAAKKLFKITTERYPDEDGVYLFRTIADLYLWRKRDDQEM